MARTVGIGIQSFEKIRTAQCFYIDKTHFIKEWWESEDSVTLITRPRRFGKTLNMSMTEQFFSVDYAGQGEIFQGLSIWNEEKYRELQGTYPVVSLSFAAVKEKDYLSARNRICQLLTDLYTRYGFLRDCEWMGAADREFFDSVRMDMPDVVATFSIYKLSEFLYRYYGKKVIILIDEYDVPLENAWFREFYDRMTDFIRSLFESALKTNDYLEFAVVTCCLRISKESIFTGLNNLKVISVLNDSFAEYFGFVQSEVCEMLENFGVGDKAEEVKQWYDGYLFGSTEVYNPWSVINYVDDAISQKVFFPKPYWSNTSSNSIVKELIEGADAGVREEIEELIGGGTIEKPVHEDITYGEIHETKENLWNFLFLTGYLKAVSQRFDRNQIYLTMRIPNEEIRYIYDNTIREWFAVKLKAVDFTSFYRTIMEGDSTAFETAVKGHLRESISFYDRKEGFYHGFLLGLLGALQYYEVVSNRESGDGRPDIMLKPYDELEPAVIMEIKCVEKFTLMEAACDKALEQIEKMDYEAGLLEEGYRKIWKYGICFCKKSCMVKLAGDGSR